MLECFLVGICSFLFASLNYFVATLPSFYPWVWQFLLDWQAGGFVRVCVLLRLYVCCYSAVLEGRCQQVFAVLVLDFSFDLLENLKVLPHLILTRFLPWGIVLTRDLCAINLWFLIDVVGIVKTVETKFFKTN